MKDKVGREIKVDDRVVYATKNDYIPELVLAKVVAVHQERVVTKREKPKHSYAKEIRAVSHDRPERILVITEIPRGGEA